MIRFLKVSLAVLAAGLGAAALYDPRLLIWPPCNFGNMVDGGRCIDQWRLYHMGYRDCNGRYVDTCLTELMEKSKLVETCYELAAAFPEVKHLIPRCLRGKAESAEFKKACASAFETGDVDVIFGAHCPPPGGAEWADKDGRTLLMLAVIHGKSTALDLERMSPGEKVSEYGYLNALVGNPNHQDKEGNSVLHYAPGEWAELVRRGADVTLRNNKNETVLMRWIALNPGFGNAEGGFFGKDTLELLRARGLDFNAKDADGRTVLHHLFLTKHFRQLRIHNQLERQLIALGADPEARDKDGKLAQELEKARP